MPSLSANVVVHLWRGLIDAERDVPELLPETRHQRKVRRCVLSIADKMPGESGLLDGLDNAPKLGVQVRLPAGQGDISYSGRHGLRKPGTTGIYIYFPNSKLYRNPTTWAASYIDIARCFSEVSLRDDFLAYHYTERDFELAEGDISVPAPGTAVRGPGVVRSNSPRSHSREVWQR